MIWMNIGLPMGRPLRMKWSFPTLVIALGWGPWPVRAARRLGCDMNPAYRRLVIPGALVGLILIVVLTALLQR